MTSLFTQDTLQLVFDARCAFKDKKEMFIHRILDKDAGSDIYGSIAGIHFSLGYKTQEALRQLDKAAKWFELPHPNGRDHKGECDFTARRLIRVLYTSHDKLPCDVLSSIQFFYQKHDFRSMYDSENHRLLYHTAKYLFSQKYPALFFDWCGLHGYDAVPEEEAYIKEFLRFRARYGWGEFDSCGYMSEIFSCLYDLYDFSLDAELRHLCRMTLDVLLLDIACDSTGGLYGGAHGRIYPAAALDHAFDNTFGLYYLYFGHFYPDSIKEYPAIEALFSSYRPSQAVYEIALGRMDTSYANRESCHLHCIPPFPQFEGYISKYTWCTPQYVIGAVNRQDDYPADSEAKWYSHHQQHEWDLTLAGNTRARIFTHHPGHEPHGIHNQWTGDCGCGCVQTFCDRNIVLATYDIAHGQNASRNPEVKQCEFIHAFVCREIYDRIKEFGNWLFVSLKGVHAALWFSEGFQWAEGESAGYETVSSGLIHGCICEVSEAGEAFETFMDRICSNTVVFDRATVHLLYHSGGRRLAMQGAHRYINGKPLSFPYDTFDSPYVKSPAGSGVVMAFGLTKTTLYDFMSIKTEERDA